jgi:hypothetical protein
MAITKISFWIGSVPVLVEPPQICHKFPFRLLCRVHDSKAPPTKLDSSTVTTEKSYTGFRLHNFLGHARMLHWCSLYIPHCRYESGACESLEVECSKIPDHRQPLPPLSQSKDCLRYCNIFCDSLSLEAHEGLSHKYCCNLRIGSTDKVELIYYTRVLNHLQIAPLLFTTEARRGRECTHASMVLSLYMPHCKLSTHNHTSRKSPSVTTFDFCHKFSV